MKKTETMAADDRHTGKAHRRLEDPRLLTGNGRYAADVTYPGTLVAAVLRSPVGHAWLGHIDTTAAAALQGVVAIYTAKDLGSAQRPLPSFGQFPKSVIEQINPTIRQCPHPTLAEGKVRYAGQPVAFVVAESREIAEDALDLIEVDYDSIAGVMSVDKALEPGAPLLYDELPDNIALDFKLDLGGIDAAFARAAHVVEDEYSSQRYSGMALEGRGLLAVPDGASLTVWAGHQLPHFLRNLIAETLALSPFDVRVIQPDIGGGFGPKAGMYSEDLLVPFAALKLGRAVKWVEDKREQLLSSSHSRQQSFKIALALDVNGKILGLRYHARIDTGAYLTFPVVLSYLGMCHFLGPYKIPAMGAHVQAILTNKTHSAPARGAGRPEVVFALNRIMDLAAKKIGMDPMQLRRINFILPSEMPYIPGILYRDGNPMVIDSGNYPEALERTLAAMDYTNFPAQQAEALKEGRYIGFGLSCNVESGGLGPYEYARVRIDPAGKVLVHVGVADTGQGHKTTLAQVCADELLIEPRQIFVASADTNYLTYGRGTYHSRSAVAAGNAVVIAARAVREKARTIAATILAAPPGELVFAKGAFVHEASGRTMSLGDCARLAVSESALGAGLAPGLDETSCYEVPTTSWANAVHAGIVEVDPETGGVKILRYMILHDCGKVLNPLIVRGQVVGSLAQGIGGAFLEDFVYDDDGNPLSTSMADYLMPRLHDMPRVELLRMENPSPLNPLGVKGSGEVGTIGPPAVIAAAIEHALTPFGVHMDRTPLSPQTVLGALRAAREKTHAPREV